MQFHKCRNHFLGCRCTISFTRVIPPRNTLYRSITRSLQKLRYGKEKSFWSISQLKCMFSFFFFQNIIFLLQAGSRNKKHILSPGECRSQYLVKIVNISYHTGPPTTDDHFFFFFNGLGLSLGAKLASTNDRPSYSSIIFRPFPSGGERKTKNAPHLARTGWRCELQGMSVENFP